MYFICFIKAKKILKINLILILNINIINIKFIN